MTQRYFPFQYRAHNLQGHLPPRNTVRGPQLKAAWCCMPEQSCACAAILALMTSFDILTNLVNVGYLFGAMMVAASVLIRRYMPTGPEATQSRRARVLLRFWLVVSFSIGAHSRCIPCFIL